MDGDLSPRVQISSSTYCNLLRSATAAEHNCYGILTGWTGVVKIVDGSTDEAEAKADTPEDDTVDTTPNAAASASDAASKSTPSPSSSTHNAASSDDQSSHTAHATSKAPNSPVQRRQRSPGKRRCTHAVCDFHVLQQQGSRMWVTKEHLAEELRRRGELQLQNVVGWFRFRTNSAGLPSVREKHFHSRLQNIVGADRPLAFLLLTKSDSDTAGAVSIASQLLYTPDPKDTTQKLRNCGTGLTVTNFKTVPQSVYGDFKNCCSREPAQRDPAPVPSSSADTEDGDQARSTGQASPAKRSAPHVDDALCPTGSLEMPRLALEIAKQLKRMKTLVQAHC